jgi:hypothetical protein
MPPTKDISGQRFGRLRVVSKTSLRTKQGDVLWECLCECGALCLSTKYEMSRKDNKRKVSCGCRHKEYIANGNVIHGHAHKPGAYQSWLAAKNRCFNREQPSWNRYGGSGITMCARWKDSFENFLADMGERPIGKTLDRFPNNKGNYEPGNCRWATPAEQNKNRPRGH